MDQRFAFKPEGAAGAIACYQLLLVSQCSEFICVCEFDQHQVCLVYIN